MTKKTSKAVLINAAVAGILAASASAFAAGAHAADDACYGVNKCKATGACGGDNHSCAGMNACSGQGWLKIDKETCLKIQGGSLTPVAKKPESMPAKKTEKKG